MIVYVDASAAAKLVMQEAESNALRRHIAAIEDAGGSFRSSILLETELRRAAMRNGVAQGVVSNVLDPMDLADITRDMFAAAGLLAGPDLRSLDALHVIAALRMGADEFISYDVRQADAARQCGLAVSAPV